MEYKFVKIFLSFTFALTVFLYSNYSTSLVFATDTASDSAITNSVVETDVGLDSQSQLATTIDQESSNIVSTTSAVANTGGNTIVASDSAASITTQDATAVANSVNLANVNLDNSTVDIHIINVASGSTETIILPRPELFQTTQSASPSAYPISTDNELEFFSLTQALAITGNNQTESDSSQIVTGAAYAIAQQYNLLNIGFNGLEAFYLSVNHPLTNFTPPACYSPISVAENPSQTLINQSNLDHLFTSTSSETVSNQASVINQVTATAITGNNQIQAETASIVTGTSIAIANSIQFINTSFTNSRLFIGIINFLGSWTGQIHFNYPDLNIAATLNQTNLNLTISNQGYDTAHQSRVVVNFNHQSQTLVINDLNPAASTTLTLPLSTQSLAPGTYQITLIASTTDPEINLSNNQAQITLTLSPPSSSIVSIQTQQSTDTHNSIADQPKIEITVTNNVVDPVFPNDTITFEVTITNPTDSPIFNSIFYHAIFTSTGQLIGEQSIPTGYLPLHFQGILRFGITVPSDLSWGSSTSFFTQSQVTGYSANNQLITSNLASTTFSTRVRLPIVTAAISTPEKIDTEPKPTTATILGQTDSKPDPNSLYFISGILCLKYLLRRRQLISS